MTFGKQTERRYTDINNWTKLMMGLYYYDPAIMIGLSKSLEKIYQANISKQTVHPYVTFIFIIIKGLFPF